MTAPKSTFRKRRKNSGTAIPGDIADWFAGKVKVSFYANTATYRIHLKKYWATWKAEYPDAVKPKGLDYLMNVSPYPKNYKISKKIKEEKEPLSNGNFKNNANNGLI